MNKIGVSTNIHTQLEAQPIVKQQALYKTGERLQIEVYIHLYSP